MFLRKGKTRAHAVRNAEKTVKNSPANTEISGGGGGEGAPDAGAGITLQPVERITVEEDIHTPAHG